MVGEVSVKACWDFWDCKYREECEIYKDNKGKFCWILKQGCKGANLDTCDKCPWYKKFMEG